MRSLTPVAATTGCAGARVDVTAARSRFPISMSDAVRDRSGELYGSPSLQRLAAFSVESTKIGILYSAVAPGSPLDISDAVNAQVTAAQGEAIHEPLGDRFGGLCLAELVPCAERAADLAGCVPITIEGEIVRRRQKPTTTAQR